MLVLPTPGGPAKQMIFPVIKERDEIFSMMHLMSAHEMKAVFQDFSIESVR